jgi:hypothetical protein
MVNHPQTVVLPPLLAEVQRRWLDLPRKQQDELYAREFASSFAHLFAALPLHGAPAGFEKPQALVSVLGFSWQPVALMAAWARPERMLVIGTKESLAVEVAGEGVLSLISRVSGAGRDRIKDVEVGDPGEADIYRAVRDFLRRSGIPPRHVFVDPTGGKKSMSASAALAGFLAGAPLVYVDYASYHGANRIPVAGTEYPRLLVNPLEVLGDVELRDVFGAFNRSDFVEAKHLAEKLALRLYEPREAECLALLAAGYAAWDRFDFRSAREALLQARDLLGRFSSQGGWTWLPAVQDHLGRNLAVLDALAEAQTREHPARLEDATPLLVWYLAAARRLLAAEKSSLALLLTYAAVERYVDLCLWIDFGLDDEAPDYARVAAQLNGAKYDEAGRQFCGRGYKPRDLEGPLMFGNGAQLLAALSPQRLGLEDLRPLSGLSSARNRCEYEHGLLPKVPSKDDVAKHLDKVCEIISRLCGGRDKLTAMLEGYRFPTMAVTGNLDVGPAPDSSVAR